MNIGELLGLAVVILVICVVSFVVKKFKRGKDNSEYEMIDTCGNCGKVVPTTCGIGEICPHCGAMFDSFIEIRPK
jgi:rRNA maturation protein Nop10